MCFLDLESFYLKLLLSQSKLFQSIYVWDNESQLYIVYFFKLNYITKNILGIQLTGK